MNGAIQYTYKDPIGLQLNIGHETILKTARAVSKSAPNAKIHPHATHLGLDAKFIKEYDYTWLVQEGLLEGDADKGFRITQRGRDAITPVDLPYPSTPEK